MFVLNLSLTINPTNFNFKNIKKMNNYFVTAIGTDCGKTLVSAILVEFLKADYWKPIQAGFPTDTETVKNLIENQKNIFHKESYLLQMPASPHAAAKAESIEIKLENIILPKTVNNLVIEGAGGILVPINDNNFVIDIAQNIALQFGCKVVLVANLYLGSINHTLLTINELKRRNIDVLGIIFNGDENKESERIILKHSGYKCLLRIKKEYNISNETIKKYTQMLNKEDFI